MKSKYKTHLICISSGSTIQDAKEVMKERRIRHLPVTNENHEIVGILSRTDLTDISQFQNLPVDLFASRAVEYVNNVTPLRHVALKMLEKKISSVLVMNDHHEVTGIITTDDLLFHLAELLKSSQDAEPEKVETTSIFSAQSLMTIGEFSRKLADIGI